MKETYDISFKLNYTSSAYRDEQEKINFIKGIFRGYTYKSMFTELKTYKLKIKKCPSQSKKPQNS